jgi:hypothetical protein
LRSDYDSAEHVEVRQDPSMPRSCLRKKARVSRRRE